MGTDGKKDICLHDRATTSHQSPPLSEIVMAPLKPTRLKEVVYTLSPFEQSVMSGLWKHGPHNFMHQVKEVPSLLFSPPRTRRDCVAERAHDRSFWRVPFVWDDVVRRFFTLS